MKHKNNITNTINKEQLKLFLKRYTTCAVMLTNRCGFRCLGCEVWKNGYTKITPKFPRGMAMVHLLGGDPLEISSLAVQLKQVKKYNNKIILWTNASYDVSEFAKIKPFVDTYFIYLPHPFSDQHIQISGHDGYHKTCDVITMLVASGCHVILNFPITPNTLPFLPEMYEFAYNARCELLIHYNLDEAWSREELGYIKRYKRVKNVWVEKNTNKSTPDHCLAVPLKLTRSKLFWIKRWLKKNFKLTI